MLSQRSYINPILQRYGFDDAKPVSTPMDVNIRLTSAQSPSTTEEFVKMRNIPYHEAVGSLMYASLGTCPDITFAVQTISRFSSKPGITHWEAVKRIFRYLKGTSISGRFKFFFAIRNKTCTTIQRFSGGLASLAKIIQNHDRCMIHDCRKETVQLLNYIC